MLELKEYSSRRLRTSLLANFAITTILVLIVIVLRTNNSPGGRSITGPIYLTVVCLLASVLTLTAALNEWQQRAAPGMASYLMAKLGDKDRHHLSDPIIVGNYYHGYMYASGICLMAASLLGHSIGTHTHSLSRLPSVAYIAIMGPAFGIAALSTIGLYMCALGNKQMLKDMDSWP